MSRLETLRARLATEMTAARKLIDQGHEEGADDARRAELRGQAETALDTAEATREEIRREERIGALEAVRTVRTADEPHGGTLSPRASEYEPVPVEDLVRRSELICRMQAGRRLTDEERAVASRLHPVERLFPLAMIERSRGPVREVMTTEQREAYSDHETQMVAAERAQRALATPYSTGTAAQGASLIPETLSQQIFAAAGFTGPMALDGRMQIFRNENAGQFKVPTVAGADSDVAARQVENADGAPARLATGSVTLDTEKFAVHRALSWEMLVGDYTSFETWLSGQAGEAFGRQFNRDRTRGDGTNKPTGLAPDAGTANRAVDVATSATIVQADVTAVLKLLDHTYYDRPGTTLQMHPNTELDLLELRASGTPVFRTAPDGKLILARVGSRYELNGACQETGANDRLLIVVGDLSQYGVLYVGGMRAAMEYQQQADQYLMSFFQSHDGKPLVAQAFAALYDK